VPEPRSSFFILFPLDLKPLAGPALLATSPGFLTEQPEKLVLFADPYHRRESTPPPPRTLGESHRRELFAAAFRFFTF